MKRIICMLLVIVMVAGMMPVTAQATTEVTSGTCGKNLTWVLTDDGILTISGEGAMTDYESASSVLWNGFWVDYRDQIITVVIDDGVTTIGDCAFLGCKNLISVTIPDSVTTIGDDAFYSCDSLTSVLIPDGITAIGDRAFLGCESLASVKIPDSVTSIGRLAFQLCDSLTGIWVDEENPSYYSDNSGVLLNKEKTNLIKAPNAISGSYSIMDGVITISEYAFYCCDNLTGITISDSVTTIGDNAFSYCSSIASISIGDGIDIIPDDLLNDCSNLRSLSIGSSVLSIDINALLDCSSLTEILMDQNNAYYSCDDSGVLYDKEKTLLVFAPNALNGEYSVSDSTTTIGEYAFYKCNNLTRVMIPESVTSIGERAFYDCTALTEICVDENNAYYSSDNSGVLFDKNKTLLISAPGTISGEYLVPDSVTNISEFAFYNCDNLTSVSIAAGVTSIPDYAFYDCGELASVTMPQSVTEIGWWSFAHSGITSIKIPENVNFIDRCAFFRCYNLTNIVFEGDAPYFRCIDYDCGNVGVFLDVIATAYYPVNNPTWTSDMKLRGYGGVITWVSYEPGETEPGDTKPDEGTMPTPKPWGTPIEIDKQGDGTEEHPYRISSEEELDLISLDPDAYYILGADFSISENHDIEFSGVFDGNHHTLTLKNNTAIGLFSRNSGTIKNLNLYLNAHLYVNSEDDPSVGCITSWNTGIIQDCTLEGNLSVSFPQYGTGRFTIGAIAGINNGEIKRCWSALNISTNSKVNNLVVGGIAGHNSGRVSKCLNTGDIDVTIDCANLSLIQKAGIFRLYVGGIVGDSDSWNSEIDSCIQAGESINACMIVLLDNYNSIVVPHFFYYGFIHGGEYEYCTGDSVTGYVTDCQIHEGSLLNRDFHDWQMVSYDKRQYWPAYTEYEMLGYKEIQDWWNSLERPSRTVTDDEESKNEGTVRYFYGWDTENQIAYFDTDPNENPLNLGSHVTEETDISFLENVDELIGTYVLTEIKVRDDGVLLPDTLISIRPVETKWGMVNSADDETMDIDGISYKTPEDVWTPDTYAGKYVRYHLYKGQLVSLAEIEVTSGLEVLYFNDWNEENQTVCFGRNTQSAATVTDDTDTLFLENLDTLLGQYVLVDFVDVDGTTELVSIKAVETNVGTVSAVDATSVTIDGMTYTVDVGVLSGIAVDDYILYHIYEDEIIAVEVLSVTECVFAGWNSDNNTVSIKLYADDESEISYQISLPASNETKELLDNLISNTRVRIAYDACDLVHSIEEVPFSKAIYHADNLLEDEVNNLDYFIRYINQYSPAVEILNNGDVDDWAEAWEELTLFYDTLASGDAYAKREFEQIDIYEAILLNALQCATSDDSAYAWGLSVTKKTTSVTKDLLSRTADIIKSKYNWQLATDAEIAGMTAQEKAEFKDAFEEALQKSSFKSAVLDLKKSVDFVSEIMEIATTASDLIEKVSVYLELWYVSDSMATVLDEMLLKIPETEDFSAMRSAAEFCKDMIRETNQEQFKTDALIRANFMTSGKYAVSEGISFLWEKIRDKALASNPELTVLLIAYKAARTVTKYLFGTDNITEELFKLRVVSQYTSFLESAILSIENQYTADKTEENANTLLNAVSLLHALAVEECDVACSYADAVEKTAAHKIANAMSDIIAAICGTTDDSDAKTTLKEYASSLQKTLICNNVDAATHWVYHLESDFPQYYSDYAELIGDDRYEDALVVRITSDYVIECPVDVRVYNNSGTLVVELCGDGMYVLGDISAIQVGDRKFISFANCDEYYIECDGYADGTMTITIRENQDAEQIREAIFYDLAVSADAIYELATKDNPLDNVIHTISCDDELITADFDSGIEKCTVHIYDMPRFKWYTDYSCDAYFICTSSDDVQILECTVTSGATEATCIEGGKVVYTATVEFNGETYTDTKTVTIDALSHSYETIITTPTCTEQGYTTYTCSRCGDSYVDGYVDATGHSYGDWTEIKGATCTEAGEESRICASCGESETREIEALGHDYESVVTAPTCTERGYTTHICSRCEDSYVDSYVDATGHTYGDWTETKAATCTEAGEESHFCVCGETETRKIDALGHSWIDLSAVIKNCKRCGHTEGGYRILLDADEFGSTGSVWVDGVEYAVMGSGGNYYVDLENTYATNLVVYTYNDPDAEDVHTQYPTGMKVWILKYQNGTYTANYVKEFDNLLQYSGSSIRITGKKGIRMITSITKNNKQALTGKGLAGYTLVEYGTALAWSSELNDNSPLILGQSYTKSNYAYKKGVADPIFKDTGKLVQYTNVLVGFNDDQCIPDIAMRPYIIIQDSEGRQITIYGGMVYRSIGYIAYQNRNAFKAGSSSYEYVWSIIHHVYGKKYDAEYKG